MVSGAERQLVHELVTLGPVLSLSLGPQRSRGEKPAPEMGSLVLPHIHRGPSLTPILHCAVDAPQVRGLGVAGLVPPCCVAAGGKRQGPGNTGDNTGRAGNVCVLGT